MRHVVVLGGLSGAAAVAVLVAGLWPAPEQPPADETATLTRDGTAGGGGPAGPGRVAVYRGATVPVPAGWTVYRLDGDPSRCVRYDRHAIYLGRPGPQPDCPARVVGRTEAVHVAPLDEGRAAAAARMVADDDRIASFTVQRTAEHEARLALPAAGVTITGVYGAHPDRLQALLRAARLTSAWSAADGRPVPLTTPRRADPGRAEDVAADPPDDDDEEDEPPAAPAPPAPAPAAPTGGPPQPGAPPVETQQGWTSGKGFDTCTAPSLATMQAWRPSFKITNIYIGGAARGCAQPNLTASWIRQVRRMGYRVTPTYVGLQAPCGRRPQRFTPRDAASEGVRAAADAAGKAKALGIPEGKPVYLDLEAYNRGNTSCTAAVLRFVNGWVRGLRGQDYVPCLYSSASSGMRDVGNASGIARPSCIWFANWDGRARLYGDPFLPDHWWPPHHRVKQYRGGHRERHGGVTLTIDSNIVDGRVH